ncbi:MAG: hypothetical protein WAV41_02465 [Microgenomates group bacterium]
MTSNAFEPQVSAPLVEPQLNEKQLLDLERLRDFQPTAIGWDTGNVVSYPDVTSEMKPVHICQFGGEEIGFPLGWFAEYGRGNPPVESRNFSDEERENLAFGVSVLRLPGLVAVHAVMNKGMTIAQMEEFFGKPENGNVEIPVLVSLGKASLQGKTVLAAELWRRGEKVISLGGFSGDNLEQYLEALGEHPEKLTTSEAVDKILRMVEEKTTSGIKEKRNWTAAKALDKLAEVFKDGNRPEMVVCDMPGYKLPKEGEMGRMANVFDFIADRSMTMVNLWRMDGEGLQTESRLDYRVVDDYCQQWEKVGGDVYRIALRQQYLFIDLVEGNSESFSYDMACWGMEYQTLEDKMAQIYGQQEAELVEESGPTQVELSMPVAVDAKS